MGLFSMPLLLATIAGVLAALLVLVLVANYRGDGDVFRGLVLPIAAVLVGGLGVIVGINWISQYESGGERRALEQREAALAVQAMAPGSALGCLDGAAGDTVQNACEQAVFAGPQATAAAVAYRAAQIDLLEDALSFARRSDPHFAARFDGLQRSIELDRFGIAAHVLAVRDGCTDQRCGIFAFLADEKAIKANLKAQAFDQYVSRYGAAWSKPGAKAKEEPVAGVPPGLAAKPLEKGYDFPSAASIPPVSIMNPEPLVPKNTKGEAKPGAEPPPRVSAPPTTASPQKPPTAPMALH
jgi:hypothetical protein